MVQCDLLTGIPVKKGSLSLRPIRIPTFVGMTVSIGDSPAAG